MAIQIETLPATERAKLPLDDAEAQACNDHLSGTAAWSAATGAPVYRMTWRAWRRALWDRSPPREAVPLGAFRRALAHAHHMNRDARAFTVRFDSVPLICTRAGTDKAPLILIDAPEGC